MNAQLPLERAGVLPSAISAFDPTPKRKFGTLSYQTRQSHLLSTGNPVLNRGDEMQGLAGNQFLPRLDAFVEADRLDIGSYIGTANSSATTKVSSSSSPRQRLHFSMHGGTLPSGLCPHLEISSPIFLQCISIQTRPS